MSITPKEAFEQAKESMKNRKEWNWFKRLELKLVHMRINRRSKKGHMNAEWSYMSDTVFNQLKKEGWDVSYYCGGNAYGIISSYTVSWEKKN